MIKRIFICFLMLAAFNAMMFLYSDPVIRGIQSSEVNPIPTKSVESVALNEMALLRIIEYRTLRNLPPLPQNIEQAIRDGLVQMGNEPVGPDDPLPIELPVPFSDIAPKVIDNSRPLPLLDSSGFVALPAIGDQGFLNSCVAWAVGYYQFSHEISLKNAWFNPTEKESIRFSPAWVYNLSNSGSNSSMSISKAIEVIHMYGLVKWEDLVYIGDNTNPDSTTQLPTAAEIWRSALKYRCFSHASITHSQDDLEIENIKKLLLDGHVLSFASNPDKWEEKYIQDNVNSTEDTGQIGEKIYPWSNGNASGHNMTLIGYHDDLWVDINGDSIMDESELGAFKIANSWGVEYGNSGYYWISYDAFFATSRVPTGPDSPDPLDRGKIIVGPLEYVSPELDYVPKMLWRITLSSRSLVDINFGFSGVDKDLPVGIWNPPGFGTPASSQENLLPEQTFYFDLTPLCVKNKDTRYYIKVFNTGGSEITVNDFTVIDTLNGDLSITSSDIPLAVQTLEQLYLSLDYRFDDLTQTAQLIIETPNIDMGQTDVLSSEAQIATISNNGVGTLFVNDIISTNPVFSYNEYMPIIVLPGESANIDLLFHPACGQQETGMLILDSNTVPQTADGIQLTGTGISVAEISDILVYLTNDTNPEDNRIDLLFQIENHGIDTVDLSSYTLTYSIYEPDLDEETLIWAEDTNVSDLIESAQVERFLMTYSQGPKMSDIKLTMTLKNGVSLDPGSTIIIKGAWQSTDTAYILNETDDWSHFVRADMLAENVVLSNDDESVIVFGLPAEATSPYQLSVELNPDTRIATASFYVEDAIALRRVSVELIKDDIWYWGQPHNTSQGWNQVALNYNTPLPPGSYVLVLKNISVIAAYGFTVPEPGDITLDGNVDIDDVDYIKQIIADMTIQVSDMALRTGDVTNDTLVSIHDAYLIQDYLSGYFDSLPQDVIIGDVNNNTLVDIVDALLVAQFYVNLTSLDHKGQISADVNGNEAIDIVDALLIAQHYVRIIPNFPFVYRSR